MPKASILIVDDDTDVLTAAQLYLKQFYAVQTEENPRRIPELVETGGYDVILLDMNFRRDVSSGREGFEWLQRILQIDPLAVVILITAYGDVDMAVQAIKAGATDFVLKPWQNEKLHATVSAALQLRMSRRETQSLKHRQQELLKIIAPPIPDFIGTSSAMQKVFVTIEKVAETDASVLITGENGTGKELVARALHQKSKRRGNPFITVDLGAIPSTLFEDELFGHVKGAFTDAREDRTGRFEVADGGTLFLDEIGNLSPALQTKLLTAIQKREVLRIGSNKSVSFDVRLICATNRPVHDLIDTGQFRQDLLYRINTIEIHLPPLRDRKEDLGPLVTYFLKQSAAKHQKAIPQVSGETLEALGRHTWPGNVRELQHAVERAVILSDHTDLQVGDFGLQGGRNAESLSVEDYNLEEIEKILVQKVLEKHQGNISHAAKELGLTRASLYRRIEKYDL